MRQLWRRFLEILLPKRCFGCQEFSPVFLCTNCEGKIKIGNALSCGLCGRRLPQPRKICHSEAPYFLAAAADYQNEVIRNLIWQLKYHNPPLAVPVLGEILFQYLNILSLPLKNFLIVPIPLHPDNRRWHGFNHALLLAEAMQKKLGLIMADRFFVKNRKTKRQPETKSREERRENLAGAFRVEDPLIFRDRNILLVDDVFTSGATMTEAVKTLKSAGVRKIIALVVARAR